MENSSIRAEERVAGRGSFRHGSADMKHLTASFHVSIEA